jgi:hypothetical protein
MPKGKNHLSIFGALKRSAINMSTLKGEKKPNAFALNETSAISTKTLNLSYDYYYNRHTEPKGEKAFEKFS